MKKQLFTALIILCVLLFSCQSGKTNNQENLHDEEKYFDTEKSISDDEPPKTETELQDLIEVKEDNQNSTEPNIIETEKSEADDSSKVKSTEEQTVVTEPLKFPEVWAYLYSGKEELLDVDYPITDIGYFGAGLNMYGELINVPNVERLSDYKGRIHMIIIDNSKSLTHFCLSPNYDARKKLIDSIIHFSEPFDGVQLDFELVIPADKSIYFSFLQELKKRLGKKILSVAIPARVRTLRNDAYQYEEITKIVDKVFVMGYDEHWSGGVPGPVASLKWCKSLMNYSVKTIDNDKLVMGLPFYGRAWHDETLTGAYKNSSIKRVQEERKVTKIDRENDIPTFKITMPVTYTFYYEDIHSVLTRLKMYKEGGVTNIGFWCLGQEDTDIWQYLEN